ncbi:HPr family phosphocarrier protein [Bifidobacterium choloepi]|uniref:Phosphocarrier protein HPr n=1 Tax=Bifidobacterium choloepi TaxID=2614131 RepID=A0A6I5N2E7_9BIFI|nr:HPr family phosphocarrier protein [Bifidobacterium choloepi]NEG69819.1 HPr family phosphocarrier protein [Bifidobacterium choloepi]
MATATRTTVINDPVGIHARPAAQFAQAAAGSGANVTIAKEGGAPVAANSILAVMGLGVKQGDTVEVTVEGDNAEAVADNLLNILLAAE